MATAQVVTKARTPLPLDQKQRRLARVIEAGRRTLVVRRQVLELTNDGDIDEHFLSIILTLYREERRVQRL